MYINECDKWENLTISNDFIFAKLMRDKAVCKEVLENLLNIKIKDIEYIDEQKSINIRYDAKSIRLDVYLEADGKVYNIEMQVADNKNLAKRTRYYQGLIDLDIIEKGETYKNLKDSFIIFICAFDPFDKNLPVYTFENICIENNLIKLEDKAKKIFFNAKAFENVEDKNLKSFLKYINGQKDNNSFINMLNEKIKTIKESKEWRQEYMTMLMREQEIAHENFEKGIEQGIEKGIEKGIKQGIINQIETLKEFNIEKDMIIEKTAVKFNKSKEVIEKIYNSL